MPLIEQVKLSVEKPLIIERCREQIRPLRPDLRKIEWIWLQRESSSDIRPGSYSVCTFSPETLSLTACFEVSDGKLLVTPGRLHLGALRRGDIRFATMQAMSSSNFRKELEPYNEREILIAEILGEGVLPLGQVGLKQTNNKDASVLMISARHVEADEEHDGFMGKATVIDYCRNDLSASEAKNIKIVIAFDSVAGGRNMIATMEHLGGSFPNLNGWIIVATHASREGWERILRNAPENLESISLFCCSGYLASADPKNYYDCRLPARDNMIRPEERDLFAHAHCLDKASIPGSQLPIAGDWTNNCLHKQAAIEVLEKQLGEIGLTINNLRERAVQTSVAKINDLGFNLEELLPYSTLIQAQNADIPLIY